MFISLLLVALVSWPLRPAQGDAHWFMIQVCLEWLLAQLSKKNEIVCVCVCVVGGFNVA